MARELECNVIVPEYPGYGVAEGFATVGSSLPGVRLVTYMDHTYTGCHRLVFAIIRAHRVVSHSRGVRLVTWTPYWQSSTAVLTAK
jgi:hypothetical protein